MLHDHRPPSERKRTKEPLFVTNLFGSRQMVPRLRTSSEPSGATSTATGPFRPRAKVTTLVGELGSRAFTQWFMKSAKKNLPRHLVGKVESLNRGIVESLAGSTVKLFNDLTRS